MMEPLASNVFFLAPTALVLEGNYRLLSMDSGGAVFNLDPDRPIGRYDATSDIGLPEQSRLRGAGKSYPPEILLDYLQLPRLDPRTASLAFDVTASAHNNYDKAVAIEAYLRSNFGYTLQLPQTVPSDPIANFLFERKRGHCEYFASAMTVMLRVLGIPSRIVNGFRTGEFNDVDSQYVVRASNAHSWVEAYFPGYGWVSFDPTPAAPPQMRTGWNRGMLYLDALASFWREWVINFDAGHQRNLSQVSVRNTREWFERLRDWARRQHDMLLEAARNAQRTVSGEPLHWGARGAAVLVLIVLACSARSLWSAFRRYTLAAHPEKSPAMAATIWYERMTRMLAKRGWSKPPAQTPEEFLAGIQNEALREPVARFTEHYESARFGGMAEDAGQLPELFEEIARAGGKKAEPLAAGGTEAHGGKQK
jgi:hypothetical protein